MPTSDSWLPGLRRRLPRALRDRLPEEDRLEAWLDVLGADLAAAFDGLASDDAVRLADALVALGEAGAPVLEHAQASVAEKQVRKLIRRGLHRLRSRGIEVSPTRPVSHGSVLKPLVEQVEQAFVTAIDPTGQRGVYLISPSRVRVRILQVLASDVSGIVRIDPLEGQRGDARRFVRQLERGKLVVAAVEPRSARALLRRLEAACPEERSALDATLLAEATRGEAAPTPGEALRERLGESGLSAGEADAVLRSRIERGAVPPWPLGGDAVAEAARHLGEAERSPLVLSELQRRERAERVLLETAERVLDPPVRERLSGRLEETGVLLEAGGDRDGAVALVALAGQIRQARGALEVPYLRSLLELSLDLARQERQQEDRGRVILSG